MFGLDYELVDPLLNHDLIIPWTFQGATSLCLGDGLKPQEPEKNMNLEMENANIL